MKTNEILGYIIGAIAVAGGLGIGAIAVYFSVALEMKTKLALIEARNKERLALIEKGMDPSILDQKKPKDGYSPLLWGLLFCGIALGALTGYAISYYSGVNEAIIINATAMLFGGAGLILYYMISKKKDGKKAA